MRSSDGQALDTRGYREAVLTLAVDRLDDLTSRLLDALFAIPGYTTDARMADAADVNAGVRYTADRFLDALLCQRTLSSEEVLAFNVLGARRTHLPREVMVAGIAAAREEGLDFLLDVAREIPTPGAVAVATVQWFRKRLRELSAEATEAMVAGHANEQSRRPRTAAQERMWLVDRLIHGIFNSTDEMVSDARSLGCDLAPPFGLCLVVPGSNTGLDSLRSLSTRLVGSLPRAIEGPSRPMPSGPHSVVLLSRVTDVGLLERDLEEAAKLASVHVLCPEPTATLESLQGVYRRTNRELRLAARVRLPPGVVTADDLAFCRVVTRASPEETADFVERFIGPVLKCKGSEQLVETLEVLYRSRGVPEAAAILGTHNNTVYSRIRRVTELTGCDLDIPQQSQRVYLGLRLRALADPDALGTLD